jgi:hypothetical protein
MGRSLVMNDNVVNLRRSKTEAQVWNAFGAATGGFFSPDTNVFRACRMLRCITSPVIRSTVFPVAGTCDTRRKDSFLTTLAKT